jgi:hypothetical protein
MTVAEEDATGVRIFSQGGLAVGIGHCIAKKVLGQKKPPVAQNNRGF